MAARILSWEDTPSATSAVLGLGCAALLVLFAAAGAVAALDQGSLSSLVGVPFVLLFAAAAVVLGLARSRIEVDAVVMEVRRRTTMLGLTVRRTALPLGVPQAVRVEALSAGGRTLHRVQVVGEHDVDVTACTDQAEAGRRARALAELLGLPLR